MDTTTGNSGKVIARRDALKGFALAGATLAAGGLLSGCQPSTKAEVNSSNSTPAAANIADVDWNGGEYDFVIVGAGGAGLGAALKAVEEGSSAVVLEYESGTGLSNTALCGGVMMACNTDVQREAGFEGDSIEEFKKYIDAVSADLAYTDLLHQWAERSTEVFEWVVDTGVSFPAEYLYYSGQEESYADAAKPYPRGHIAEGHVGSTITSAMEKAAVEKGAEFVFNTQVTNLFVDEEGTVVGVGTGKEAYKANKAVILASGGFSRNEELLKNYIPDMIHGGSFGSSYQQGDAIKMGLEVGAKLGNMWAVQAKCTGTYLTDTSSPCNTVYSWGNPCVMVTEDGVRKISEDTFYEEHYAFISSQPNSYTFIVWDQSVTDLGSDVLSVPPMSEGLKAETDAGTIYKADTYEELAKQMGVPEDAFAATMTRYNEMMNQGGQDLDLGREIGLGAVDTPPFYAAKLIPAICDTAGGLVVNTDYQVLNNNDEPIPGLYATGAASAGWRGKYYCGSGTAVSYAIVSGRIAVESVLDV